jgi:hypothetical protein
VRALLLIAIAGCSAEIGAGPGDPGAIDAAIQRAPDGAIIHDPDAKIAAPDAPASSDPYQLCVDKTNALRATVGKPPVARSTTLETYANAGAMYDYSHQPHDHFKMTNGGGISFAENECPHWDLSFGGGDLAMLVSKCIDAFWSEGPGGGHYDNMTGPYAKLGCGLYHVGTDYTIIQDYGN